MLSLHHSISAFVGFAALLTASPAYGQCEVQKMVGSNVHNQDQFAFSLDIQDGTIVAGCYKCDEQGGESGAAYVFTWDGFNWSEQGILSASDGAAFDRLGWNVALDGDRVLAGAPNNNDAGNDSGSAYIYDRLRGLWSESDKLVAPDAAAGDQFGKSVVISGDLAIVGAPLDDTVAGVDAGSVYVFELVGGDWLPLEKLTAGMPQAGALFGSSLAIHGDTLAVGAHLEDDVEVGAGAVYLFEWNGISFDLAQRVVSPDGLEDDRFGVDVALREDRMMVGAPNDDDFGFHSGANTGVVFYFERTAGTWNYVEKLRVQPQSSNLGAAVDFDGDWAVVGAFLDKDNGTDAGAAFGFRWNGSTWEYKYKFYSSDIFAYDEFSGAVAVDGDQFTVSSDFDDDAGWNSGSLYTYSFSNSVCAPMYGFPDTVNLISGGRQDLQLDFGSEYGGYAYWVLGSFENAPGFSLPGGWLPLNVDFYFNFTVNKPNSFVLPNTFGFLDNDGRALAGFRMPPFSDISLAGTVLYHAGVALEYPSLESVDTTNAQRLELIAQ